MKAADLYLNYVYKYMNMFRVKFIQWKHKNDAEDASILYFSLTSFPDADLPTHIEPIAHIQTVVNR